MQYRLWGKRAFDILASTFLLLLLSPVMVAVMLLTWAAHGTPILFRQVRPGLKGKPFVILKFRTMRDTCDSEGEPVSDNLRTTLVGHMLRKSSLDELPELFNVLRGDMSLVGPRPLLMCYLPRYSGQQARRHDVRPGITGLAQVHGRNSISWDEKFAYDVEYVDHYSFAGDVHIMLLTIFAVLRATGVNANDQVTMPEFYGTASQDAGKN